MIRSIEFESEKENMLYVENLMYLVRHAYIFNLLDKTVKQKDYSYVSFKIHRHYMADKADIVETFVRWVEEDGIYVVADVRFYD
jgi:hypothetical protein